MGLPQRDGLDFSRPAKPMDDAFIEAFNGRFRQEFLNESRFLSLENAEEKVESRRKHYCGERPHSALGDRFPRGFVGLATMWQIDPENSRCCWYRKWAGPRPQKALT